jgi:hypothetical protein
VRGRRDARAREREAEGIAAALTEREREVLALVAEAISPRTSTIAITPVHELSAKGVPGRKQGLLTLPLRTTPSSQGAPSLPG